eukprot:4780201-Prymnesium_polylepis.1
MCRARLSAFATTIMRSRICASADTSARSCGGEVALDSCFRGRGRDGSLSRLLLRDLTVDHVA